MGFDEGSIILNSENETYYVGQTIYGKLVFQQDKVKTFRGLYVKIKGFCKVQWTTTHTRKQGNRNVTYQKIHKSHEEYFRKKEYLLGSEDGEYHLQPGKHELPFDCQIPANCPSSFEGSFGHVRYEIKFVVDRAFKLDQKKKKRLRVIAPLDLNVEPYCKEPMQFDIEDTYCCCCMSYGSSETVAKLPVSGYCAGQVIPIELNCTNHGKVKVDIKLAIKKKIAFYASLNPDTRHQSEIIAEIKKGPVPGDTTRSWMVDMEVPVIDVYNMGTCRYIDIDYEFKVTVSPKGCHRNSDDTRRIVIGTIPMVGQQDNIPNPLQDQMPIFNESMFPASSYPPNPYPVENSPYPGENSAYPSQNSPYPGTNQPHPSITPSYPNANQPYPGAAAPYPGATSPYPLNQQINNSPYPGAYPTSTIPINPPYPAINSTPNQSLAPYPPNSSPYPAPNPSLNPNVSPYPGSPNQPNVQYTPGNNRSSVLTGSSTSLKTGTFGFIGQVDTEAVPIPSLPPGANVPYPTTLTNNPYATASAPEPATPDDEKKTEVPYNSEYISKKDEK
ncbi:unnamed protein product [Parnassius apollo]|uniref:(apollo) hypothetical protein n=1 Tax=Parnassius apollo TaxID=110799 RepID=A0A8S3WEW9_PARAO|nr:unnamed protein product [Parnassius apollo]